VRILISAGEASGEMYGAQLIEALRAEFSDGIDFFGVGGDKMRAAGCDTVVDAKDLSVVGITEILGHLPKIWGLFHRLIEEANRRKPDLAIVIDSPAFNWRVARQMKKRGVPVVYYVAPQFWAWRQGRVKLLRKYVDKALVIFPFEEKFYRDSSVDAEFVGHPLAKLSRPSISREEYAASFGLDPAKLWLTLMPGSRRKEVRMNLPGIVEAAALLNQNNSYEFLLPVAPTLDTAQFDQFLAVRPNLREKIHLVSESLPALAHSRAGIVASGTATVEAALMNVPFVMVYRVTGTTYLLGRSTVKVPYFAMVNLIAEEKIVPELVQHEFTPERVAAEVEKLIPDGEARARMLDGLQLVRSRLRGSTAAASAPENAARAIRALLQQPRASN
jgi:lipid-A-disaccharide synthase